MQKHTRIYHIIYTVYTRKNRFWRNLLCEITERFVSGWYLWQKYQHLWNSSEMSCQKSNTNCNTDLKPPHNNKKKNHFTSSQNPIMPKLSLSSAELRLNETYCLTEFTICMCSCREQCEAPGCQKRLFQHNTQVKVKCTSGRNNLTQL